jgi:hypothetical protein
MKALEIRLSNFGVWVRARAGDKISLIKPFYVHFFGVFTKNEQGKNVNIS